MSRELALEAKSRGNAAFSKGAYQEAISAFSEAIQHDPSDHVFFSNRSACYAGLSQFKEALDDAEKCVELAPKWVKGYSRKGLALFRLGKLDEALEVYQKGLELDPANEGLKTDIQSVQNELNRSKMPPNPFAQLFGPDIWMKIRLNPQLAPYLDDPDFVQKVNTLQQNPQAISSMLGDDKIKKLFGALIGMDFGDMSAAPEESQMEVENDDVPKDEDIGQVREASPEQKPMKEPVKEEKSPLTPEETEAEKEKLLGNDFYKKKQFSEAEAHYMKAHELAPNNPVYLTNLSAVYLEKKENEKVVETLQKVLAMSREQIINFEIMHKTWARLGQAYINLGQLSEAISAFESALVEKYDRKIELKLQKTRQDKKTKDAELYLDEEKSLQHRELGNKAFQDGRWSDAIAEYSEAIRRNPKDHRCYSNRSACFSKLMEWGKALEDAEKTIELDPSFVKGYLRKARVEQFLKKYHKALETYKTGLEMCPDSDDLKQGMNEVRMAISMANYSGEVDEERQKRALQDPEIQAILQDPMLQRALQSMQEDPVAAQKLLADPSIRSKVETLVAAGVLQMR